MIDKLVLQAANLHGLSPDLVAAIVAIESHGEPYSIRYEPGYPYLKDPKAYARKNGISFATELLLQRCSFGLMQIMGGTARQLGFEELLTKLLEPETGLEFGCRYLASRQKLYPELEAMIAAYNGGSPVRDGSGQLKNQGYVTKVLSQLQGGPRGIS